MRTKNTNVVAIDIPTNRAKAVRLTDDERFRKAVAVPDENGCELWTLGQFSNGYGMFSVGSQNVYAHRYGYSMHYQQPIPEGKYVLHSVECTSRLCTAKDHLRIGTAAENSADMVKAGHSMKGKKAHRRTMTDADRQLIGELWLSGVSQYAISKRLNRSEVVISYNVRKMKAAMAAKLKAKAADIGKAAKEFSKALDQLIDQPKAA